MEMEENGQAAFCNLFIAGRPATMVSDTTVFLSILGLYFSQFENYISLKFETGEIGRAASYCTLFIATMISDTRNRDRGKFIYSNSLIFSITARISISLKSIFLSLSLISMASLHNADTI